MHYSLKPGEERVKEKIFRRAKLWAIEARRRNFFIRLTLLTDTQTEQTVKNAHSLFSSRIRRQFLARKVNKTQTRYARSARSQGRSHKLGPFS